MSDTPQVGSIMTEALCERIQELERALATERKRAQSLTEEMNIARQEAHDNAVKAFKANERAEQAEAALAQEKLFPLPTEVRKLQAELTAAQRWKDLYQRGEAVSDTPQVGSIMTEALCERIQELERALATERKRAEELQRDLETGFMQGAYARLKNLQQAEAALVEAQEHLKAAQGAHGVCTERLIATQDELAAAQRALDAEKP